jgi:Tfp pilus assembly protein PilN
MPQQINLLTPLLLTPKRQFSATTMLRWAAGALLLALGVVLWALWQARDLAQQSQSLTQAETQAREALVKQIAAMPASADVDAIRQQIDALAHQLAREERVLRSLGPGVRPVGERHSDVLAVLSRSAPASVWLTELRWRAGQLELKGQTLDPPALRGWVDALAQQGALKGLKLQVVKVERSAQLSAARPGQPASPIWAFELISADAPVAPTLPAPAGLPGPASGPQALAAPPMHKPSKAVNP